MADGYVQANIVMLPAAAADDFQAFCEANPIPCPLLERTPPGQFQPAHFAPGADLRTDAPRYRVYRNGVPDPGEPTDVLDQVQPDMVGFLLGCSFTFESAMARAGFELRHQAQGVNVPMYQTTMACRPAGAFAGPMVVSMRPVQANRVPEVCEITARYPSVHGAPVHAGDPATIGIRTSTNPTGASPWTSGPAKSPSSGAAASPPRPSPRPAAPPS